MKTANWVLVFALILGTALPAAALNEWTVMLYLVSDDKESSAMVNSHVEALNKLVSLAGQAPRVEVVIQVDAPPGFKLMSTAHKNPDGGFLLEAGQNGKWSVAQELGEINMGSPYSLWSFLKWTAKTHPAKKYALFVAGHGSGIFSWRGTGNVSSGNPGAVDFNPDRFVGYDDTDDDCLTIFEIQAVLEAFKTRLANGHPLDVLALDSCMPGAIEALYQFRDVIRIIVSSPSTTLIGGMPYAQIVRNLAANVAMTEDQLGEMIAKSYVSNLNGHRDEGEVMGVFRPAETKALVGSVDQLAIELLRASEEGGKMSFKNLTTYGGKKRYWDLGRLLNSIALGNTELAGVSQAERIRALAKEAVEALKAGRVTTWYSGGMAEQKVSGLSIAWPEKDEYAKWRAFYGVLDFAKDTHWDEFLDQWNKRH